MRAIRRDAIEQFKKMKKDSEITEDDQKAAENRDSEGRPTPTIKEARQDRRREGKGDHGGLTQTLLGLPLEASARACCAQAGTEPRIIESRAPRRSEARRAALRVVRVQKNGGTVEITVSRL